MFWDNIAGVYDLFANVYNRKTHKQLIEVVTALIDPTDEVLECACGTGMLTSCIAQRCRHLVATDFSSAMLRQAERKCREFQNIEFQKKDIFALDFKEQSFDKVVAANVIHLLDNPQKAVSELNRVCRRGGKVIIPTYINKEKNGQDSMFSKTVGRAGADFKRQFTYETYKQFFANAGFPHAAYTMIEGRVPCAVAVISKQ